MTEWQPIDKKTTPADTQVMLGKWSVWRGEAQWNTEDGVPFKTTFFGLLKIRTRDGEHYSHWMPLPEPPLPSPPKTGDAT